MNRDSKKFTDEIARAVNQVCSPLYTQLFERITREQPNYLSNEENLLLTYYPNEITWYQGHRRQEIIERIRRTHLKWFNKWLSEHNTGLPPYVQWGSVMDDLMLSTTNLFFRIDYGDVITSETTRNTFRQIADTIKRILSKINQSNPVTMDRTVIPLVQTLLLILFYFTLDSDLVIYLKNLQLVDLMNELIQTSNNDSEINLQAYRIQAIILTELDIQQLRNADKITSVFISFIKNVIDGGVPYHGRLHNSLRSLRTLTQHDEIRKELIKQEGYILILRCALENQFNSIKAKLPALEILLALAFNQEFAIILRNNTAFMNHLRTLISSSEQDLQRVSTAFIWKLEKEQQTIIRTSTPQLEETQYNVMISYSHTDKDLCHRILNVLEKDQLNIWIDSKLKQDVTFDTMAKAIENAEFVLVCMSDAYKQSPLCEMEASYAVKRRCHIIPIIMTPNFKPDGWLGLLTSELIYIDFPELGFEKACIELKKQIEHIHQNHNSVVDETSISSSPVTNNNNSQSTMEYPHCIDMWNEEHVKSFLLDKDLDVLLSVFDGMNGQLVHQAYKMCQTNQQGMFLSMKDDISKSTHGTLSLKDYLTFLKEIKAYIPYTIENPLSPTSAICGLM